MGHTLMSFPTEDLYRFSFLDISLTDIKGKFQEIYVNVNAVIRRFCGGLMGHGLVGKIGDIKAIGGGKEISTQKKQDNVKPSLCFFKPP